MFKEIQQIKLRKFGVEIIGRFSVRYLKAKYIVLGKLELIQTLKENEAKKIDARWLADMTTCYEDKTQIVRKLISFFDSGDSSPSSMLTAGHS